MEEVDGHRLIELNRLLKVRVKESQWIKVGNWKDE